MSTSHPSDLIDSIDRRFASGRWDDVDVKMILALSRAAAASTDPVTVNAVEAASTSYAFSKNVRESWRLRMEEKRRIGQ